jgi:hypothetical protein
LDCLYILEAFNYSDEISPLEYAKLKKRQTKVRVRKKAREKNDKEELGW